MVELNKRNATTESLEVTRENHKETTAGFHRLRQTASRVYTAGVVDQARHPTLTPHGSISALQ
jgi:hypothetical protein